MARMTHLTPDPIDPAAVLAAVRHPHCGGVVLFLGTVRDLTGDVATAHLDYDAYPPMAAKVFAEIETHVRAMWPVGGVAIAHRVGRLGVGDVAVAVAVSCPHRAEAFAACRYAIDAVKALVPIWKRETAPDGTGDWVHPGENPAAAPSPPPAAE